MYRIESYARFQSLSPSTELWGTLRVIWNVLMFLFRWSCTVRSFRYDRTKDCKYEGKIRKSLQSIPPLHCVEGVFFMSALTTSRMPEVESPTCSSLRMVLTASIVLTPLRKLYWCLCRPSLACRASSRRASVRRFSNFDTSLRRQSSL